MQEPVYVLHLITCHGRIMPRLAELLLTSCDPQTCPRGKIFVSLNSTLHYLRFNMQHDYICTKWILNPSGPHGGGRVVRRYCVSYITGASN